MKATVACALCCLVLFCGPVPARAHPETGLLPDAIAEMEYKIVLDITPNDIKTRNKLGMVLCRKNKLKEAAQAFGEVLKSQPDDFDALNGMGLVRLKEQKTGEALAFLEKAATLNRDDTQVYGDLGAAYERAGDLARAQSCYRKGLEVNAARIRRGMNEESEKRKRAALLASLKSLQEKITSAKVNK